MQKQLYFSNQQPNEFQPDDAPAFIGNQVELPHDEAFSVFHYHGRYEIGICDGGDGIFWVNDKLYYLSKGDLIFISPNIPHYSRSLSQDVPCFCRFVYFDAENIHNLLCFVLKNNQEIIKDILKNAEKYIPAVLHMSRNDKLISLLINCIELCKNGQPYLTELTNLKIVQFLIESYNQFFKKVEIKGEAQDNQSKKVDKLIATVSTYLSLHYNESDTVKSLAQKYHLSESQFSKRFFKVFGISPIAYRINLRCKVAAEFLEHTELSIQFIASKVGYTDTSEFYKAFNKVYGMSPTSYRKARVSKHRSDL